MLETTQNTGQKVIFITVSRGQLVVKLNEQDSNFEEEKQKAKARLNKLGNQIYERFYNSVTGMLQTIHIEDNIFGEKTISIGLEHEGTKYVVFIKADSSYGRDFFTQIFNINIKHPLTITPWQRQYDDKLVSKLYLSHGRDKVKMEKVEGCPEVKWVEIKGKPMIDNISKAEADAFLEDKLNEFINQNNLAYTKPETVIDQKGDSFDFTPDTDTTPTKTVKPGSKKAQEKLKDTEAEDDDFFSSF